MATTCRSECIHQCCHEFGAARSKWVAKCNHAAPSVELCWIRTCSVQPNERHETVSFQVPVIHDKGTDSAVSDRAECGRRDTSAFAQQLHRTNGFERAVITITLIQGMKCRAFEGFDRKPKNLVSKRT